MSGIPLEFSHSLFIALRCSCSFWLMINKGSHAWNSFSLSLSLSCPLVFAIAFFASWNMFNRIICRSISVVKPEINGMINELRHFSVYFFFTKKEMQLKLNAKEMQRWMNRRMTQNAYLFIAFGVNSLEYDALFAHWKFDWRISRNFSEVLQTIIPNKKKNRKSD